MLIGHAIPNSFFGNMSPHKPKSCIRRKVNFLAPHPLVERLQDVIFSQIIPIKVFELYPYVPSQTLAMINYAEIC